MLEVCAYDDGSCKGFIYDSSEAGMKREVAELTGDLVSPNSARGRELAAAHAGGSGDVGGYWGDTPLSPDGFRLAFAAINEAKRKLAKIRRRNALATMRRRKARARQARESQEESHVPHAGPRVGTGRLDAATRRGGNQPKLKAFTVTAHIGTKRSGTYHGTSGASAKTAAALEWGMKPEDLTASEDPGEEIIG